MTAAALLANMFAQSTSLELVSFIFILIGTLVTMGQAVIAAGLAARELLARARAELREVYHDLCAVMA